MGRWLTKAKMLRLQKADGGICGMLCESLSTSARCYHPVYLKCFGLQRCTAISADGAACSWFRAHSPAVNVRLRFVRTTVTVKESAVAGPHVHPTEAFVSRREAHSQQWYR
jgi:hypothetical protein